MTTGQEARNQVVMLLTNGISMDAAESMLMQKHGMSLEQARECVTDARQRITIAADFSRDEQIGKAVMRFEDLYTKSIAAKDTRTALQAQRELNRLLGLYSRGDEGGGTEATTEAQEAVKKLELIAGYLLPLRLTHEGYPVEEHARIASEIIRRECGIQSA